MVWNWVEQERSSWIYLRLICNSVKCVCFSTDKVKYFLDGFVLFILFFLIYLNDHEGYAESPLNHADDVYLLGCMSTKLITELWNFVGRDDRQDRRFLTPYLSHPPFFLVPSCEGILTSKSGSSNIYWLGMGFNLDVLCLSTMISCLVLVEKR